MEKSIEIHAYYTPNTPYCRGTRTSKRDLVHAALFSKDFPEVPSHEAVGMAALASVEVRKLYKIINEIYYYIQTQLLYGRTASALLVEVINCKKIINEILQTQFL